MSNRTVIINGKVYDRKTGKILRHERGINTTSKPVAGSVHTSLQKSRILNRKYVRQDAAPAASKSTTIPVKTDSIVTRKQPTHVAPAVTHPEVKRFVKPAAKPVKHVVIKDIAPTQHHLVQKVAQRSVKPVQHAPKPSQVLKREAIDKATASMPSHRQKPVKPARRTLISKTLGVASAAMALLLMGGYLTYLTMPSLSTRVAAAQAGINATYPAYKPSGYSLSGPVAFQQGNVTMKFAANAGPQSYTVSQSKSGWDSSAVLDNYVAPKAGNNYTTQSVNGLTIYTYEGNAAWINSGILYTISGNAPLSTEQVERIATSM